jgi:MFS family permease
MLVSSGNFLEMYDFMVFGYYATAIAQAYFPLKSQFASIMLTLMTFGAGFLMRPIGALLLGAYVDKHGRRKGLVVTLGLMAIGTLAIAFMPTYSSIGILAPIMILISRLVQGLSAGVEVGGVSVYLSEIAPPEKRGAFVAWQSASQQVAVMFAALLGLAINFFLPPHSVQSWGWRIPFVVGCLLIPFLLFLRSRLEETQAFLDQPTPTSFSHIFSLVAGNSVLIIKGLLLAAMTTIFFYMITAYTPTFGTNVLHLTAQSSFIVTFLVGITNFGLLPIMGGLSDRIGRRPLLIVASAVAVITGYPAMHWLVQNPTFGKLLTVEVYFAVVYATYNAAMVVFLTEAMPQRARTVTFSLAYSLATGLLGGFTPAIATMLIHVSGDRAIPGVWLSAGALMSLIAIFWFNFPLKRGSIELA